VQVAPLSFTTYNKALLVCVAVFIEGVFEGGNSNDVVSSICGGSAEEARHSADSIVLRDL